MALARCRECGAAVSEFAGSCPHCGFSHPPETKTGKLRGLFETGLAGTGCLLGLALILALLFAPLLPFLAVVAAVWVFAKLYDATTKKTDQRPANGTAAKPQMRSTASVGEPDPERTEKRTRNSTGATVADTIGLRVRSIPTAARTFAGRAVKRYWRRDTR